MPPHDLQAYNAHCERLEVARGRAEYDNARQIAGTLAEIAPNELTRLWAAYLAETIETARFLGTENFEQLLRPLARSRHVLLQLQALLDDPNPGVDYGIAEVDFLELHAAMQLKSMEHPRIAAAQLEVSFQRCLVAREAYARSVLGTDGQRHGQPRWPTRLLDATSVSSLLLTLKLEFQRDPNLARARNRLKRIVRVEMDLAQRRQGPREEVLKSLFSSAEDETEFGRFFDQGLRQWRASPGAIEVEALFRRAYDAGFTTEQFFSIRDTVVEALFDALFRGVQLFVGRPTPDADPEARAHFIIELLGFLAEVAYKPWLIALADVSAIVDGAALKDRSLGGIKRYAKKNWAEAPDTRGLYNAVIDREFIELRNAGSAHHSEQLREDGSVLAVSRTDERVELTFEQLQAKASSVVALLVMLFNAWNYLVPPGVQLPGRAEPGV